MTGEPGATTEAGARAGGAVALVSGGLDSVTLAHLLHHRGHAPLHLVSIDYGQRHLREIAEARVCADRLGARWDCVDLRSLGRLLGGSALTDASNPFGVTIGPDGNRSKTIYFDAQMRVSMRREIARLHQELKVTMTYVTHDQVEAMTLGDRIVVMNKGHVMQIDTPLNLYEKPTNRFVAGFIGNPAMNFANGTVEGGGPSRFVAEGGEWEINLP